MVRLPAARRRRAQPLCDGRPIIVPFHQGSRLQGQARGKRAVGQKTRHRCGKVFGVTGDEQMLAVLDRETFAAQRRGNHGPSQRHGFENLEAGSSTGAQRNNGDMRVLGSREAEKETRPPSRCRRARGTRPARRAPRRPPRSGAHPGCAHAGPARCGARGNEPRRCWRVAQVAHEDQPLAGGGLGQRAQSRGIHAVGDERHRGAAATARRRWASISETTRHRSKRGACRASQPRMRMP